MDHSFHRVAAIVDDHDRRVEPEANHRTDFLRDYECRSIQQLQAVTHLNSHL